MPYPAVKQLPVDVLKIGGSVLTDLEAYHRVARFLVQRRAKDPQARLCIIVSAQYGETDRLAELAESFCIEPDPRSLDLLWSTGETRSVALLTLALKSLGQIALGLNVHECGLARVAESEGGGAVRLNPLWLHRWLHRIPVVILPGFLATGPLNRVVTLGRGGSDLSAVLIATGLGARRCELIKDVPGYFSKDPHLHADAEPLHRVSVDDALRMAAAGCDLVQSAAIEAAGKANLPLIVRSLDPSAPYTLVSTDGLSNWPAAACSTSPDHDHSCPIDSNAILETAA